MDTPGGERTPKQIAHDLALRRITLREHSASELASWLKRKGHDAEIAREVVSELVERGLVDDGRYAAAIARHHALRGKGPAYVAAKLREKGVRLDPSRVRELTVEAGGMDEIEAARRIVERRYPEAYQDRDAASRAYQALIRRGFSSDVARRAVRAPESP